MLYVHELLAPQPTSPGLPVVLSSVVLSSLHYSSAIHRSVLEWHSHWILEAVKTHVLHMYYIPW